MDSKAPVIGHIAYQWIQSCSKAKVQGVTSSGIFVQLDGYQIIFLTNDPNYGPLNLIVSQSLPDSWQVQDNLNIILSTDSINIIHSSEQLKIDHYEIWNIPPPPPISIMKDEQLKRLKLCATQINTIKGNSGFSPFLPILLKTATVLHDDIVFNHILEIRKSLTLLDSGSFIQHAKAICGYGRGLTPSGDDLICGILFILNRWRLRQMPAEWIQKVNSELLNHAIVTTTSASISLIYCATLGSADYRIQELADALIDESIHFQHQAMQLARWGGSSGADIFAGILITIQSLFNLLESEYLNAKTQLPNMRK